MARHTREFRARPISEQYYFLEHTWCDACSTADLGMSDPQEYEEDGVVVLEGCCVKCGGRVRSELHVHEAPH